MAVPTSGPFATKTAGTVNTANRQHCPWTANPVIVCSLGNTCRAIQQLSLDLVARFVLTKG